MKMKKEDGMEGLLNRFDFDDRFGPFIGITRLKRWQRAKAFGLNPPKNISSFLVHHPTSQPQLT